MEILRRVQRTVAKGWWPAPSSAGALAARSDPWRWIWELRGGVAGARGIIEKTMAIVLGLVISTPKSGSLQAKQRLSSFLTSWGCGEVTTEESLAQGFEY